MLVVAALGAACGGDDDDGPAGVDGGGGGGDGGGADAAPPGGTCEPASSGTPASGVVRIGARRGRRGEASQVEAVLVADPVWTFSGLAPQFQVEAAREGDCVLHEYEPSLCEPACDGLCVDETCRAYPEYLSAGTLHVEGLGDPVELEPDALTFWGAEYRADVAAPPAGTAISVCADGDDTAGFTAEVVAVEPLDVVLLDDLIVLRDGEDLPIDWTPSSDPEARVRLTLNTDNERHGLPYPATIVCDAPDQGQLVVPQALIERFPAVTAPPPGPVACSSSDCPVSRLVRYRAAEIQTEELSLEVIAEQAIEVYIGH
jgi:hypothetical protein